MAGTQSIRYTRPAEEPEKGKMEISLAEILRRVGLEALSVHRVSPKSSKAAEDGLPQWEVSTHQERNLMPSGQESDLDSGLYEGTDFFFRPSIDDYR